jgi:DNA helicase HerA-like ATPase
VAQAIGQLGVGEALCSMLLDKGVPMPVERTMIAPPRCRMGAITDAERAQVRAGSPVGAKYDAAVDRDSAAEMLAKKAEAATTRADAPPAKGSEAGTTEGNPPEDGMGRKVSEWMWGTKRRQGAVETMTKQVARTVGSQVGRQILRGVLGGIFGGRR